MWVSRVSGFRGFGVVQRGEHLQPDPGERGDRFWNLTVGIIQEVL